MEDCFTKCNEWSTGIDSLDAQHDELADCIREIEVACCSEAAADGHSPSVRQQLSLLLGKLYRITKEHFRCEEAAMLETGYPGHAAHQREHIMLLAELKVIIKDQLSGANEVDAAMAKGLRVWFLAHVKLSDCKFSCYISDNHLVLE